MATRISLSLQENSYEDDIVGIDLTVTVNTEGSHVDVENFADALMVFTERAGYDVKNMLKVLGERYGA